MTSFHVLIVVWPVSEVVIALNTGVRSLAGMLPSMSLIKYTGIQFQIILKSIIMELTVKTPLKRKRFPQNSHSKGMSPV